MIPRFSKRFERDSSGLESLFTLSEKKDAISFAGGYPAEELFPKEELDAAFLKRSESTDSTRLLWDMNRCAQKLEHMRKKTALTAKLKIS